jgi:hypothetical protein
MLFDADTEGPFRFTEAEAKLVAALAQVRTRADAGDKRARAKIAKLERQVAALARRARKGDAKAARTVRMFTESGLLEPSQVFAMEGTDPWSWRLGDHLNVLNVGLIAAAGILAWKRRWLWAAAPLGVLVAHEGHKKSWW